MPDAIPVILIEGDALDLAISVLAIDVTTEVNRIPRARVTFAERFDPADQTWDLGKRNLLAPGKAIEVRVRAGADGTETSLFKGSILRLSLEARPGDMTLTIEAAAGAHRLTQGRHGAVFPDSTDEDAIRTIVDDAALTVDRFTGPSQPPTHETLVRHGCSDWDFILARADALGLLVTVADTALSFAPMATTGSPAATLEVGRGEILDFAIELDAGGQHPSLDATGWDRNALTASVPTNASDPGSTQGSASPASLGEALHLPAMHLTQMAPLSGEELKAWADARLARRRLAMVRGRVSVSGGSPVAPLDVVKLSGTGDVFDGNALVSGVRHRLTAGTWRSDLQLGLPAAIAADALGIEGAPAAGLLPPACGLHLGVVAAYKDDPIGEYRARVMLPAVGAGDAGLVWARLATPNAGAGHGHVFRPAEGDEVVVAFLGEDPRHPIILGALFSSKNAPDGEFATPDKDNVAQGIATAHGAGLAFRDRKDKPAAILRTKRGTITIDDDKKSIEVTDTDGNTMRIDKDGFAVTSAKDITLDAKGKITIKGSEVEIA